MKIGENCSSNRSVRHTEGDRHGTVTKKDPRCSAPRRRQPRARIRVGAVIRAPGRLDNNLG
jgi:hypothetical protein